ncbi:hypothetical protein BB558_001538 [Smittium angustum]|uniref:AMP-dependent synthetase/ligase domain-containing protein n=1 Tax=Smittium angustum TaxID=133377 RepID=A0A2U1JB43_SMIAN|nr:hypothetical protein BB558_001538 [Smittium angustum]
MRFNEDNLKAYVVPNSAVKGSTPVLRNLTNIESLDVLLHPEIKTAYDIFWESAKKIPNEPYLGYRPFDKEKKAFMPYEYLKYGEVAKRVTNLGAGLMHIRLLHCNSKEEKELIERRQWSVAIYSNNRPEWMITEFAIVSQSLYSVGLCDTLGESSMEYIINHSEITVVVGILDKTIKVLRSIKKVPNIRAVVVIESTQDINEKLRASKPLGDSVLSIGDLRKISKDLGVDLYTIDEVEAIGNASGIKDFPPKPDDIYTILYTSGTTGNPKGVVLTHTNYTVSARSYGKRMRKNGVTPVMISYLPLPHGYGRMIELVITLEGGILGYSTGDVSKIFEDCQALQPTFFPGVPRLLTRLYDQFTAATVNAPGIKGIIARKAFSEKLENMKNGKGYFHSIWDNLIFNKTRSFISNRLNLIMSGSAPLSAEVADFLRIALCTEISEAYGSTETSATGTMQIMDDTSIGHVGPPNFGMEIKLRDVPEMNYLVTDEPKPRGEVCIRGKAIFREYLKDKENTENSLIGDGWFATGDIGRMNEDGTISIIDRKKSIFKISQGEYVAPEKIEIILMRHPLVMQAFVHGFSDKSYIIGIIVPDPTTFVPWAANILDTETKLTGNAEKDSGTFESLCKNKNIVAKYLEEISEFSRKSGLVGFEILKKIYLEHIPFDIEGNGLLTPTFKLKRGDAIKAYKEIVENMYASP